MKLPAARLAILFSAAVCLLLHAQEPARNLEKKPDLPGWGTPVDPDGDCKFFLAEGALLISVPGSNKPHDLAPDIELANAPRVIRSVNGDFTIQVCVEGRFSPGETTTKEGRLPYNGAGLFAMADEKNLVTLARAVLQQEGEEPQAYANFEIRVAGELLRFGLTSDHPLPKDGPVYLRLERKGARFLGSVSTDGVDWDVLEAKEVPAEWAKELQAGVIAISTSAEEFDPHFSKLKAGK